MTRPWLSVVMPTYNGEAYLENALDSVAGQADSTIEIVAVDDGSTDRTRAILARYARRLPMRTILRAHSGNWAAHTNLGLSMAAADYACILHQDDCWMPGRLRRARSLLSEYPSLTLLLHASWFIDSRGRRVGLWRCPLPCRRPLTPARLIEPLLVQNFIAVPAPIFHRTTALDLGSIEERWRYAADWDLWLKLAGAGTSIYDPRPLTGFRIHDQSQTMAHSSRAGQFRRELEAALSRHLSRFSANSGRSRQQVERVAEFSVDVNAWLAGRLHGEKPPVLPLLAGWFSLGPRGWRRYWRDSRIWERVVSRLRARLHRSGNRAGAKSQCPGRSPSVSMS